jgi:hypothetical protein
MCNFNPLQIAEEILPELSEVARCRILWDWTDYKDNKNITEEDFRTQLRGYRRFITPIKLEFLSNYLNRSLL